MSRFTAFARALVLGVLSLALLQAPAAAGLPAWLASLGLALDLGELFADMAPVEAPERRFLDEGRAALDAGDIAAAALAFEAALAANPDSVEALVLLGLIREQQARPGHAAALYRRALDVAELRRTTAAMTSPVPAIAGARTGAAPAERGLPAWVKLADLAAQRLAAMSPAAPPPVDPSDSLAGRLAVLDALLDAGYIDVAEHQQRRATSLGAWLVRSAPPPSAVLAQPSPAVQDVLDRFVQLDQQRTRGAATEEQWRRERLAILDALLPLDGPRLVSLPPLDEAALAALVQAGGLAEADARGELAGSVAFAAADPAPPAKPAAAAPPLPALKPERPATAAPAEATPAEAPVAAPSLDGAGTTEVASAEPDVPLPLVPESATIDQGGIGIHVASFRTPEQAQQGWEQLLAANSDLLGGFEAHIAAVDHGDRGVYFEVSAGPMTDATQALQICAALVARGLFCATTVY